MWILYAFGSALFAGITSILAKCGIKRTDSNVATAVRTVVVLIFAWMMVLITGSQSALSAVSAKSFIFLILSGIATGASWLCYFRALQIGNVNKVTAVDKFSTVLTIILAFIVLGETSSTTKITGAIAIGAGTFLMIQNNNKATNEHIANEKTWFIYAFLSALFAALTAILAKIGIENVESNPGTAIRTTVVLIMSWIMVLISGKQAEVKQISKKEFMFISFSGIATGASWLCYYKALHDGPAGVVVPIDKLSILITVTFSGIVFGEKLTVKAGIGLLCITIGTVMMLL